MQDKYFTHDQFQSQVLDKRPPGADINDIINTFVSNGYTIQGVNEPKPQEPGFLDKLKSSVTSGIEGVKQADATYTKSNAENAPLSQQGTDALGVLGAVGTGIAKVGGTVVNSIPGVQPAMSAIANTAQTGLNAYDKNLIQPLGESIRGAIGADKVDSVAKQLDPAAQSVIDYTNQPNVQKNIESAKGIINGALTLWGVKQLGELGVNGLKTVGDSVNGITKTLPPTSPVGDIISGAVKSLSPDSANIMQKVLRVTKGAQTKFEKTYGTSIGQYAVDRGLIGTQEQVVTDLANRFTTSIKAADDALASLPGKYKPEPVKTALQDLYQKKLATSAKGAPDPELNMVKELLNKYENVGLDMSEINQAKRLYERNVKLDFVKTNNPEGVKLANNIDDAIRSWQFNQAERLGLKNLPEINKETRMAKDLLNSLERESSGKAGNNAISLTDWIVLADGGASNILAFLAKKGFSSDTAQAFVARYFAPKTPKVGMPTADIGQPQIDATVKSYYDFLKKTNGVNPDSGMKSKPPVKQKVSEQVSSTESIPQTGKGASGKMGGFAQITKDTSIPKELQPLVEEARKYKSAEEFVNAQFTKKPEYGMSHRPSYEGMPPAYNLLEGETLPRDVYTHPDYSISSGRIRSGDKAANESWNALQKIKDNPEAEVTLYRAGAKNELNTGDWVTFSKDYAKQSVEGSEKVHSFKAKAKDVIFAGDDINEFGYYPKSKYEEIYNQAHQSQSLQEGVRKVDPLIQEARKYKSAEEFVSSQGTPLLHGTGYEKNIKNFKVGNGELGKGLYLTPNKSVAGLYGNKGKVYELYVPKSAIYEVENFRLNPETESINIAEAIIKNGNVPETLKSMSKSELAERISQTWDKGEDTNKYWLEKAGYQALSDSRSQLSDQVLVFDPKKVHTKQQLIDLWNKANKGK